MFLGYLRSIVGFSGVFYPPFLDSRRKICEQHCMLMSPLCTDFYQITMAYGYFREGIAEEEACFHISFRKHPFKGGFTIAAGLEVAAKYISNYKFNLEELDYLYSLRDGANAPYFSRDFIDYLAAIKLTLDIDAIPEGTPVFPLEPLMRIRGPLAQCQLLETPLLNIINFQSLIATKAARLCLAAQGTKVIDFGLRRAQGFDGGLSASRAAYIGGCSGTSNVLAGLQYGIPLNGTMAHSFVMRFGDEKEAFKAFAKAMPTNSILLTDTYNTLEGITNAIAIGHWLKEQGYDLAGVRLDSGDLEALSKESRRALDLAGFSKAKIIASNELDEYSIAQLKKTHAPIDAFGVGTRLVTAFEEPALGGVYKLAAVRKSGQDWQYRIKLSDDRLKTTLPGILQVRRYEDRNKIIGDILYDESSGINAPLAVKSEQAYDLLVKIFARGELEYAFPPLPSVQLRTFEQLNKLAKSVVRLRRPKSYPVKLDQLLIERKQRMENAKSNESSAAHRRYAK